MSAFITYDSNTGAITGCFRFIGQSATAAMASNTPSGQSALAVDDGSPVFTDETKYKVQNGALVSA